MVYWAVTSTVSPVEPLEHEPSHWIVPPQVPHVWPNVLACASMQVDQVWFAPLTTHDCVPAHPSAAVHG
jgi:hypothetical protein